ncbi:MAG: hypothetical protein MSA90_18495 [Faecalicatena sp.]|uniref:hypothetical protein n=1 Tax=Faecalicatena sp. TaxID=2005360 RepID=UPI00258A5DE0|nr:hypothetical protein [Faecalicatena sp.]MCI6467439.1 hypothetical protein [Faecalicatena sp.]MDY5618138.1 hypothetical protein [Lachnospiraceae bacterium]
MEKIILKDNTEIGIKPGASIGSITAAVADFAALGAVAEALTAAGNLEAVKFQTDGILTGEYQDMKLETPLFRSVDIVNDKVEATFSVRKKTETEKRLDALENGQAVTDEAVQELIITTLGGGE